MLDLAFNEYGKDGPPLIVLHGLFGCARNWAGIARSLSETRRVYVLDLRNHGASPHAPTMAYDEMAQDVGRFIAAHGIVDPIVMGHSMGGKVAMRLALDQTDLLRGLIVVDIAPVTYRHDMMDYIVAMQVLDLSGKQNRAELEDKLREEIGDADIAAFLMTNLERVNGEFHWRINLPAISAEMSSISEFPVPDCTWYGGPTAFIAGEHSVYIRVNHRSRIRELFPEAFTVTIRDASHWVHADQSEAFIKTVTAFLQSVP
ncbi:MAG: Esterase YbfF [Alphaproteobacteria bacterium MarineAlpha11_Bin1]|nr:MAG: Esterase YbfF [Alphaproteobacteria bacterium MarineAlpha11_Bin1]|tara:strand:+ start:1106 stop:1882 length:777 start_codon:yes stop_codon:yes gene_type:complete